MPKSENFTADHYCKVQELNAERFFPGEIKTQFYRQHFESRW